MKMKVRCVGYKTGERAFTKGKIYTWENDKLVNDNGFTYDTMARGTNIDDWDLSNYYIFEKVEDRDEMTDEEIWNMLSPKLEKNGIYTEMCPSYVIKAVVLAYVVGYKRGEKGRPFKYNNVKTNPNKFVINENGDKIYYNDDEVVIGDKVVFISHDGGKDRVWPEYGTVGKVVNYGEPYPNGLFVRWEGRNNILHNWREYCKKVVE